MPKHHAWHETDVLVSGMVFCAFNGKLVVEMKQVSSNITALDRVRLIL